MQRAKTESDFSKYSNARGIGRRRASRGTALSPPKLTHGPTTPYKRGPAPKCAPFRSFRAPPRKRDSRPHHFRSVQGSRVRRGRLPRPENAPACESKKHAPSPTQAVNRVLNQARSSAEFVPFRVVSRCLERRTSRFPSVRLFRRSPPRDPRNFVRRITPQAWPDRNSNPWSRILDGKGDYAALALKSKTGRVDAAA